MLWTFWNWKTLTHFCNQTKPLETTSSIKLNSKPTLTLLHTNLDVCITYGVLIFLQRSKTSIYILSKLSLAAATYQKRTVIKTNILREKNIQTSCGLAAIKFCQDSNYKLYIVNNISNLLQTMKAIKPSSSFKIQLEKENYQKQLYQGTLINITIRL